MAIGLSIGAPAEAQLITANDQPAEFPPSSYTGRQYVDSAGCVFVRAGFDGAVTWVPRVSRSRKKLCGFTPSTVRRADAPVIADAPGTPAPTASAPVVAPERPRVVVQRPVVAQPRVVTRPVAPAPVVQSAQVRQVRGSCPGASAISAQYINPGARCGPQAEHPSGGAVLLRGGAGTPVVRSLPVTAPAPVQVPKGYRNVWKDDRLNPNRGKQLLSGALQTALVWTQTVPRRLVDNRTGADVTRDYNYLVYPYTDYAKQKRDLAGGQHIVVRTGSGQRMIVHKSQLAVSKRTGQTILKSGVNPTYSTKSVRAPAVASARVAPKAGGGRYVQVGTFGVEGNARKTAARLQQAGLPVRIGTVNRKGRALQIVMAGPFGDAGQAQSALSAARRAGFADAFLRN